ncbi:hypothetical protein XMM379_002751 [Aliiroseovarius sp. xm-m-379]|uniref:hypothetical protein n=1 Tax=unclassified Aliiroseovarius TaxID=2623558 RepID=UPI00156A0C3D|nr:MULTISPECIES: hypothetical protein [unclassified Aliiroseovarius]NRP26045.1 hypothetical protein [Aliiroseovarius sp. xm-m-379]NRP30412.1 hypothetical protein [Aliiroseovarius sp. xm-m-314]NRP34844.1 hypothetical protein [Aliiroseovarius sp. xm-a-104]NRP42876.1 hypothetical protein [Aliiroseovarius sp. xm-m-378]NRP49970.1 hypothetical protein [Aliiroseovarius sp. xm-m-354]
MTGWLILRHSLRMMLANYGFVIFMSLLFSVGQPVSSFCVDLLKSAKFLPTWVQFTSAFLLLDIVYLGVALLLVSYVAVRWHRRIILGNTKRSWNPFRHGRLVLVYWWKLLGLSVLYIATFVPFLFVYILILFEKSGGMLQTGMNSMLLLSISVGVWGCVALFIPLRLSPILVAAALDEDMCVKEAWLATRGSSKAIFDLLYWAFLAWAVLFGLVGLLGFGSVGIGAFTGIAILVSVLFFVGFGIMAAIAIITTIYDHFVEGLDLV